MRDVVMGVTQQVLLKYKGGRFGLWGAGWANNQESQLYWVLARSSGFSHHRSIAGHGTALLQGLLFLERDI
jgi:hypothetical protein